MYFYTICWKVCVCLCSSFFLCRPQNCTSFLNLSSKCATSPVSRCWDSVVRGAEGWRGVQRLVRREERDREGIGGDNQGGEERWFREGGVWSLYVGHGGSHPFHCFLPLFCISSAIIPSLSPGCWVYLGGLAVCVCVYVFGSCMSCMLGAFVQLTACMCSVLHICMEKYMLDSSQVSVLVCVWERKGGGVPHTQYLWRRDTSDPDATPHLNHFTLIIWVCSCV